MSITGEIQWDPGPFTVSRNGQSAEIRYWIKGSDAANETREDAMVWLETNAPAELFGLTPDTYSVDKLIKDDKDVGDKEIIWDAKVVYKNSQGVVPILSVGDVRYSVRSSAGESLPMLYSRSMSEEVYAEDTFKFGGTPAARMLGLEADTDKDSGTTFTIKGINVPSGSVELVVEAVLTNTIVTQAYAFNAAFWAGRNALNDRLYAGFPEGSLQIKNFDLKQQSTADNNTSAADWNVTFAFGINPPTSVAELNNDAFRPPGMEGKGNFTKPKRGWDRLEILYVDKPVVVNGFTIVVPSAVRMSVQEIFESINLAAVLRI